MLTADTRAKFGDKIRHIVELLGRSKARIAVFDAIYSGGSRPKSVDQIEKKTSSKLSRQVIINEVNYLQQNELIEKFEFKGKESNRKIQIYGKVQFINANKTLIRRCVDDPRKLDKLPTFANQSAPARASESIIFVKTRRKPSTKTSSSRKRKKSTARLRVAFLTTNPSLDAPLRTDMEVRDVLRAIKKSENRDLVDIKHLPAATVDDLLDALNEFRPNILHFSGHGGDETLLFDSNNIESEEGVEIDFGLVHDIISSTNEPPEMIVFNACDTLYGAEVFLDKVPIIIAMSSNVSDAAAVLFAERFYSALAAGQSVEHALKQGRVVLRAAKLDDADLPSILPHQSVSPDEFKFVD